MKLHLLVDTPEHVDAIVDDPVLAEAVAGAVDGFWVRDVPGRPEDGDTATGLDPVALSLALHHAAPTVGEIGVAVFGAGYWTRPTLVRAVHTLRTLVPGAVNIGLGGGDKADVLALCGISRERRHEVMREAWSELQQHVDAETGGATTYWVATTRREVWRELQGVGGLLLPMMPTERLRDVLGDAAGRPSRAGMLLRIVPDPADDGGLGSVRGPRGLLLQGDGRAVGKLVRGLAEHGVTDVVLSVEDAKAEVVSAFLDDVRAATGDEQ